MVRPQSKPSEREKYRAPRTALDVENYPVAPSELELAQVHVYVRHGERTPVSTRMSGAPGNIPERWNMCREARRFRAAVAGDPSARLLDVTRIVEQSSGQAAEGECLLGELTDTGRASTFNFGQALRRLYIEKLGLLPDTLTNQADVYFRSTNMPRTVESLQQVIHGLYPMSKCDPLISHRILVRNGREENLIGNTLGCKRLETLLVNFATAAAAAYNPTLEPLDKRLSKYLGGNPIRVDGKPRASGILDTIRAAMAHGLKVPSEFEERSITSTIERAVVNEWFSDKTEEVRRLGMGRLLGDLITKMEIKANEAYTVDRSPKILIHSTHDTALAALANTLDVFDDRWPGFTASITFELFKHSTPSNGSAEPLPTNTPPPQQNPGILQSVLSKPFKQRRQLAADYYVRARYQNRNLVLPLCAEEGKHLHGSPEFCTLEAFAERVIELVPKDWDAECSV
ncbi:phosphoglycerate mutase-like protein [Vararia minispora EC-137]|uniref:Phosphoglycerate mutase-like protein n=1 Tax=Vararia minispora EC-137 TaxID=1314806 RepID=A0ACB8QJR6_9AGAM|nr:phosphoglycerate mutase-like protein [Vararia minispora EC-137]